MKNLSTLLLGILLMTLLPSGYGQTLLPHLRKSGTATQLIVEGNPFLILGGELGNSTATTLQNMEPVWARLTAMHVNTVLIPVYWELVESQEGQFDFSLYRSLLTKARTHELKVIFLWFGSWKNSMSSHAPAWVKRNQQKYPRAADQTGRSQEILSSFSEAVLAADLRAFEALMQFLKDFDGKTHTVIMVQVENEIGMLPSARDHQALAEEAFQQEVPAALLDYLQAHRDQLVPEFLARWKANDYRTGGNWETVFGKGLHTDEIFMAWYYARFANALTAAGKKIYPLPMFVNAALNRPGREPGQYPSAGPRPHLMDVWKAGGPEIDFLAPDFYNPDFAHWCDLYTRQGDPLFVPEHAFDQTVAAKALFAIANYEALGFAPFSIESRDDPSRETLGEMYQLIDELSPFITAHQGQGKIQGVLLSKANPQTIIHLGNYELTCKHDYTLSWTPGAGLADWPLSSIMIVQTGEDEFFVAGTGVVITFQALDNQALNVGLLKVEEGKFVENKWTILRHLNGDQTHQGRHVSIPVGQMTTQRVELYRYE